jgi:hypothetical protein
MDGIISSQEMSRGSCCPILHAQCGSSPEMTSPQSRGPIFTQKNRCLQSYGIHSDSLYIDKLPTGTNMHSGYFATNIVGLLQQKVFPTGRNPHGRRLTIHLDNCSIHTRRTTEEYVGQQKTIRLQHSPYSPDLTPSDFY